MPAATACNLIFVYLRGQEGHGEKCGPLGCAQDCGYRRFEAWLDAPLLPSDHRREAEFQERAAMLKRGEIPR